MGVAAWVLVRAPASQIDAAAPRLARGTRQGLLLVGSTGVAQIVDDLCLVGAQPGR